MMKATDCILLRLKQMRMLGIKPDKIEILPETYEQLVNEIPMSFVSHRPYGKLFGMEIVIKNQDGDYL